MKLGFIIKIVFVWLEDDWNYSLEIMDFKSKNLHIDKNKHYDKN